MHSKYLKNYMYFLLTVGGRGVRVPVCIWGPEDNLVLFLHLVGPRV